MKIECTTEEFQALTNVKRLEQLREYYEVAKSDHESIVRELEEEKRLLNEKLQQLESDLNAVKMDRFSLESKYNELQYRNNGNSNHTSETAKLIKASVAFFSNKNYASAASLRDALNNLFPNQKIAQIKIIREVANCGLKDAKDFVDGLSNWIPSPAENTDDDIPF